MAKNANMINAKKAKNDEFFTQFEDITKELCHSEYREAFKGKKIYCPFSSPLAPYFSQFYEFFKLNFLHLGLQSLLCTYLVPDGEKCMAYFINGDKTGDGVIDDDDIEVHELEGNGDFFSDEIQNFVDWADVIVDNVPFSRFREIVDILMGKGKQFAIIGNNNAIIDKEVFPYLKNNQMFIGYNGNVSMEFRVPDDYDISKSSSGRVDEKGTKYVKVPAISWFTNIPLDKHSRPMLFGKTYVGNEGDYPKVINLTNCILVSKCSEIPGDYIDPMAVPITFMNNYCPWQFKIIGLGHANLGREIGIGETLSEEEHKSLFSENNCYRVGDLCYRDSSGKLQVPYTRLIIQRIK